MAKKTKTSTPTFKRDLEIESLVQASLEDAAKRDLPLRGDDGKFMTLYNDDIGREICVRVAHGQTLRYIGSLEHIPSYWVICKWLYSSLEVGSQREAILTPFRRAYAEANAAKIAGYGDELVAVADEAHDRDSSAAAKVKVSARQFMLERCDPKNWSQATRSIEDETVEDFKDLMMQALTQINANREKRLSEPSSAKAIEAVQSDGCYIVRNDTDTKERCNLEQQRGAEEHGECDTIE